MEGIGRVVMWVVASLLGESCGREWAPVEAEPSAIGERCGASSNWSLRFIRKMFRGSKWGVVDEGRLAIGSLEEFAMPG